VSFPCIDESKYRKTCVCSSFLHSQMIFLSSGISRQQSDYISRILPSATSTWSVEIFVSNYPLWYAKYIRPNSSFTTSLKVGDLKLADRVLSKAFWNKNAQYSSCWNENSVPVLIHDFAWNYSSVFQSFNRMSATATYYHRTKSARRAHQTNSVFDTFSLADGKKYNGYNNFTVSVCHSRLSYRFLYLFL
jgi:hypothetical protein